MNPAFDRLLLDLNVPDTLEDGVRRAADWVTENASAPTDDGVVPAQPVIRVLNAVEAGVKATAVQAQQAQLEMQEQRELVQQQEQTQKMHTVEILLLLREIILLSDPARARGVYSILRSSAVETLNSEPNYRFTNRDEEVALMLNDGANQQSQLQQLLQEQARQEEHIRKQLMKLEEDRQNRAQTGADGSSPALHTHGGHAGSHPMFDVDGMLNRSTDPRGSGSGSSTVTGLLDTNSGSGSASASVVDGLTVSLAARALSNHSSVPAATTGGPATSPTNASTSMSSNGANALGAAAGTELDSNRGSGSIPARAGVGLSASPGPFGSLMADMWSKDAH